MLFIEVIRRYRLPGMECKRKEEEKNMSEKKRTQGQRGWLLEVLDAFLFVTPFGQFRSGRH